MKTRNRLFRHTLFEVKNYVKFTGKNVNRHSQNSLGCISNWMFFLWNNCFFVVFSYQFCLLGLYVTSNVVKLMFIPYFSLMSPMESQLPWWCLVFVWMMPCTFFICYYLKAACDGLWFIMWLSHYPRHLVHISALQRYRTDFSTSIGWYINNTSVNEQLRNVL